MPHIVQLTSATTCAPVSKSLFTDRPILVLISEVVLGGEEGAETRNARPCRPVKPFDTICEAKARSVAQVMHFSVLGAVCLNLVSFSVSPDSGMFCKAAWRLETGER